MSGRRGLPVSWRWGIFLTVASVGVLWVVSVVIPR